MRARRGVTVIEMLVSMVLFLLVLTIAYQLLSPAWRVWSINQTQATVEELGVVVETKVVLELERSTWSSVTILPADQVVQAVSFAVIGTGETSDSYDAPTGSPVFQSYVIYFVPAGSSILYRKVWPTVSQPPGTLNYPVPTLKPQALSPGDLMLLCTTTNGSERQVGTDVAAFTPVLVGKNAIQVTVDLATPGAAGLAQSHRSQTLLFRM